MEYLKKSDRPAQVERGLDLHGTALTPRSERPRASYGSLEMSVQTVPGLCALHRKCIKKAGHASECWPGD